jgi:tetratricopeptide (TPR) repeat protein
MYYFAREYDEAESYCHKALAVAPDFVFAHEYLIDIYLKTGREADAYQEFVKRNKFNSFAPKENEPEDPRFRLKYLQSGMRGFLLEQIEDLGKRSVGACYALAKCYARLGDKEQALAGLEKSYAAKDFLLPFVHTDPVFDDLRAEPRFQSLLHRMGFSL